MRHRISGVKLNRTSSHRDAMFRNMVTSLFKYERIRTTDAKAKELRRWADHLVTLAKRGDLHARRQAMAIVREKAVVHKLFEDVQEKFGKRKGGYTRVIKLGYRPGDAAKLAMIELVQEETAAKKKKAAPKPKTASAPAPTAAPEEAESAAEAEGTVEAEDTAQASAEDAVATDSTAIDAASEEVSEAAAEAGGAAVEEAPAEKTNPEEAAAKDTITAADEATTDTDTASDEATEPEKKEE
jgi:large subunit ribosomal protein L17